MSVERTFPRHFPGRARRAMLLALLPLGLVMGSCGAPKKDVASKQSVDNDSAPRVLFPLDVRGNSLNKLALAGQSYEAQDYEVAINRFRLAAEQGMPEAQFGLAVMHENGFGVTQDYPEAVRWYRLAAEQGMPEAQAGLAVMFENGLGVDQDYDEARKWYLLAVEQGEYTAQNNLGLMYKNGIGVTQDYDEATKWLELAAGQGYPPAWFNLGLIDDEFNSPIDAYWRYKYAAGKDMPEAQVKMAEYYRHGLFDRVQQDYSKAVRWYRLAAEQGFPEAQLGLADMYKNGLGVDQDHVQAYMWLSMAVDRVDGDGVYEMELELSELIDSDQVEKAEGLASECVARSYRGC